jgi:hypothetical protein
LGSTGYVSFKIKPLRSSDGADISNFGDIYFDYNEPVRTDTAEASPATLRQKSSILHLQADM